MGTMSLRRDTWLRARRSLRLRPLSRNSLLDPWGPRAPKLLLFDVLLYAGLAVVWRRETRTWWPLWIAAAALELAQFVFFGHTPHLQDLAAAWAGLAAGALVARRVGPGPAREAGELSRRRPALGYGFALGLVLLYALEPFRLAAWRAPDPRGFVPLAMALAPVTRESVASLFAALGVHVPLAHVLLVRGARAPAAAATCAGVALLLEVAQLGIEGRVFDLTDVLLAAAAAWIVARAHAAWPAAT